VQVELLKAGVLTVNEVRAMRGLGPLEPVPLGQDATAQLAGEAAISRDQGVGIRD
jgi:hypothetical protein